MTTYFNICALGGGQGGESNLLRTKSNHYTAKPFNHCGRSPTILLPLATWYFPLLHIGRTCPYFGLVSWVEYYITLHEVLNNPTLSSYNNVMLPARLSVAGEYGLVWVDRVIRLYPVFWLRHGAINSCVFRMLFIVICFNRGITNKNLSQLYFHWLCFLILKGVDWMGGFLGDCIGQCISLTYRGSLLR
jgi:hypothetical protein